MAHGSNELQISKELPHLVGKCVYFVRNSETVSPKDGITAKSIENDVSWCVSALKWGLHVPAGPARPVRVALLPER